MMNILCVSDTIDPLVYSSNIKRRYKDIDLVLGAGDLPMNYLGFIASSLNCPLLFVFGNHNLARYETFKGGDRPDFDPKEEASSSTYYLRRTYGATYIGDKLMRVKGTLFAGLGGSARYNHGRNQYTEFQMYCKIIRLMPRLLLNKIRFGRFIDILLTHAAPRGVNDLNDSCHLGFRAFKWFIKMFRPAYLIHGHIHLYDFNAERVATYLNTTVINVYSRYVLKVRGRGGYARNGNC